MVKKLLFKSIFVLLFTSIFILQDFDYFAFAKNNKVISDEEAGKILSVLDPGIKVLSVERAPVEGLWEVVIESKGRKVIVYIDYARKNILFGNIFNVATKTDLTRKKFFEINRIDTSLIPLEDALVMGDPKARHKVIVFDDPD